MSSLPAARLRRLPAKLRQAGRWITWCAFLYQSVAKYTEWYTSRGLAALQALCHRFIRRLRGARFAELGAASRKSGEVGGTGRSMHAAPPENQRMPCKRRTAAQAVNSWSKRPIALAKYALIAIDNIAIHGVASGGQPASAAFTAADTWPMSALPARRVLTTPITLPMSPGPAAPSSATMALTAARVSSADMRSGR